MGSTTVLACPPLDVMVRAARALLATDEAWDGIPLARTIVGLSTRITDLALADPLLDELARHLEADSALHAKALAGIDRHELPSVAGLESLPADPQAPHQLQFFTAGHAWHRVAISLLERLCDQEPRVAVEVLRPRSVGPADVAGFLGNAFADAVPEAPGERPVAFVTSGASTLERSFERLVELWALQAYVVAPDNVRVTRRVAAPAGDDLLVSALNRVVTWGRSRGARRGLAADGMDVLVDGSGLATRSLLRLLGEERATVSTHSACADLLDQMGFEGQGYARRLRELVDHWTRNRLWDQSMVHEMVLHDAVHSVHVDRNVASLVVSLVEHKELDAYEVFVLAVSAWLHDWGHSSAGIDSGVPTLPAEVRIFHGLLTAFRILDDRDQPQHDLRLEAARRDVALLCAHHQGWTSCDDREPKVPQTPETGLLSIQNLFLAGHPSSSYVADHATLAAGGHALLDYERSQSLLAILRVADAADMGQHRVPHRQSRARSQALLAPQLLPVLFKESPGYALLYDVHRAQARLEEALDAKGDDVDRTAVDAAVRAVENELPDVVRNPELPKAKEVPREILPRAIDLWSYSKHLANQRLYFATHAAIRHVVPVLQPVEDDELRITLHVMTAAGLDEAAADRAIGSVAESVLRELGKDKLGKDEDQGKGSIVLALRRFDIKDRVETVRVEMRPAQPDEEPPSEPRPRGRCFVQYRDTDGYMRLFVDAGGALVSQRVASADESLSPDADRQATVAASSDGAVVAWVHGGSLFVGPVVSQQRMRASWPGIRLLGPDETGGDVDRAQEVLAVAARGQGYRVVLSSGTAAWEYDVKPDDTTRGPLPHPLSDAVVIDAKSRCVSLHPHEDSRDLDDVFPGLERLESVDVARTANGRVFGAIGSDLNGATYLMRVVVPTAGEPEVARIALLLPGASALVARGSRENLDPDVLAVVRDGSRMQRWTREGTR